MSKILNIKPQGLCALGYVFRVTWWRLVVWCVALQWSMVAIIEASIYRGSKLDMAASDDMTRYSAVPRLRRCCPPVLLSSYRSWNRRDRKSECVQCAISVFRVLSGGDEVRALVTRLFSQGHNPTCQTSEFTKFDPFNVTGKIYHVTILLVVWKCLILCQIIVICTKCWFSSFIRIKRRLKRIESSKKFTEMLL